MLLNSNIPCIVQIAEWLVSELPPANQNVTRGKREFRLILLILKLR